MSIFSTARIRGDGSGGGGGGTPAAPQYSVQFNNPLGTFDGDANFTFNPSGGLFNVQGDLGDAGVVSNLAMSNDILGAGVKGIVTSYTLPTTDYAVTIHGDLSALGLTGANIFSLVQGVSPAEFSQNVHQYNKWQSTVEDGTWTAKISNDLAHIELLYSDGDVSAQIMAKADQSYLGWNDTPNGIISSITTDTNGIYANVENGTEIKLRKTDGVTGTSLNITDDQLNIKDDVSGASLFRVQTGPLVEEILIGNIASGQNAILEVDVTNDTINMNGDPVRIGDFALAGNQTRLIVADVTRDITFAYGSGISDSYTFPVGAATVAGQVLTDVAGNGNLSWETPVAGGVTSFNTLTGAVTISAGDTIEFTTVANDVEIRVDPPGSDTQVLFNDGGVVGADAGMVFNKTDNILTVDGIKIFSPTSNTTIVGDGAGNTTATGINNTGYGANVFASLTDGLRNTQMGVTNGVLTGGDDNATYGYNAGGAITTSIRNTIFGSLAGQAINTDENTFIGYGIAQALNTGAKNTIVGANIAPSITDIGDSNVFIGESILGSTVGGSVNITRSVGIGNGVFNNNSAVPIDATGVGSLALGNLTTALRATALGSAAGNTVTTGDDLTLLGYAVDVATGALTNAVALGVSIDVWGSNVGVIGTSTGLDTMYLGGKGQQAATPIDVVWTINRPREGTDSNGAGTNLTVATGLGTGAGDWSTYKLRTPQADHGTATSFQTYGDRQFVSSEPTTLTEGVATSIARVAIPTDTDSGGTIEIVVRANDGTDFQTRTLTANWSAVNKAGTITTGLSTPVESVAVSAGTLTCTLTAVDAGSGNMDFDVDCTSSLTQTTLQATVQVTKNFGTGNISRQ